MPHFFNAFLNYSSWLIVKFLPAIFQYQEGSSKQLKQFKEYLFGDAVSRSAVRYLHSSLTYLPR